MIEQSDCFIALLLTRINPTGKESGLRIALFSFHDDGLQNCNVGCPRATLFATDPFQNKRSEKDKQTVVIVIGDSFLMEGIGLGLQKEQALDVIQMETFNKNTQEHLKSLQPELIIFELNNQFSANILSMIAEKPNTIFLAIDNDSDRVIELQSNSYTALNMKDFFQLVCAKVHDLRKLPGGKKLDMIESQYLRKFK